MTQQNSTFWVWGPGEAYSLKFKLGWDFCTMHPTIKFHHPMFNRLEVILLKNK